MNPESPAWQQLHQHAARQLRPGFADRVLRVARAGVEAAPSLLSQFLLCAATAATCFAAVALLQAHNSSTENQRSLAAWQDIASATSDTSTGQ
jgi:hypothetical protein